MKVATLLCLRAMFFTRLFVPHDLIGHVHQGVELHVDLALDP